MTLPPFRAGTRVVVFSNTDWYLHNVRLSLARGLRDAVCDVKMVATSGTYCDRFAWHGLRIEP